MFENLYTTKMSMNKKKLQNRFSKIRSVNAKIHKAVVVFITIVVMLSMICANVVMAVVDDKTSEQYIIEVKNADAILNFNNKPFIKNNTVYFPLRETFEKFGIMENKDSYINWDNGKVEICVAFLVAPLPIVEKDNGVKPPIKTILTYYRIKIGVPEFIYNATKNLAGQDMSVTKTMTNAPVLVNGVTYVPFDYLKEINIKHLFVNLAFTIKDNNGNILYELPYIYSEEVQFKSDLN